VAEIKVLKGERTTVGPVGIVQMGTGGVRAGRQMQEDGKRIFEEGFKFLVAEETKEGEREAANAAIGARDTNGNWVVPEIPQSLSYVAKEAYEPIARKRYIDSLALELDLEAKKIAAQHERDPEGFNTTYGTFLDGVRDKLKDTEFVGAVESIGLTNSRQYQNALFIDQVNFDDKIAAANAVQILDKKASDIESLASSGGLMAGVDLQNAMQEAHGVQAEHGDRLGASWLPTTLKKLRLSFTTGNLISMSNKLADSAQITNPDAKQPMLAADLNYMSIALEKRSMKNLPLSVRKRLEGVGFTEKYITDPLFNGLHKQLAREIRTRQGTVQEQFNAEKDIRLAQAAIVNFGNNGIASKTEANAIMNYSPVTSPETFVANLSTIMIPPQSKAARNEWDRQFGAVHDLLFENRGPMPTVAKDFLENIDAMQPEQIPVAVAMYQQATQFNQGSFMERNVDRGLDDKTVVMYETLGAVMDTLGPARVGEFLSSFRENDALPAEERKARLLRITENKGTAASAVREFVIDSVDSNASEAEIGFYSQYADDLLLTMDKKTVKNILSQASEKIFKESEFLHPTIGRSRFTPERAYSSKIEMNDFKDAVGMKLSLVDPSLKLGETAFLVPDTREGTALPVYNIVNGDKQPIMHNGKMLQVGNQLVLERMEERRKITIEQLRKEAAEAEDQYVDARKAFEELTFYDR